MNDIRRIGILTSGGDAPGMNAAIRAIVRDAVVEHISCLGIHRGYAGLINNDIIELDARSVDGIQVRGGTMLYTARCDEFRTQEGIKRGADVCKYMGIDAIIAIGGDGTFRGAKDLAATGIPTIGIPATIDNDIACTHYTIGFDTACNTAIEAIDKLRDTMQSHERCSVVEVMGHESGNLAMYVGIAAGATATLIPERETKLEEIYDKIREGRIRGRNHHIIIVAEGIREKLDLVHAIQENTGIDTRETILGHVQRGGSPSARDRVTAARMGCAAIDALKKGRVNRVVINNGKTFEDIDIEEALSKKKSFREDLYHICERLAF
ncbi:MAG: 6-phosphofructokinase [Oscillospiraceae bacterium]|nr:6-phosphofructokinase [Oscillospiraceae bacterium]